MTRLLDFARQILLTAGFSVGALGTWQQVQNSILLTRAHAVWEHGETASEVTVGPRGERGPGYLDSGIEKLRVSFKDGRGARHTVTFDVWALNTSIDDSKPAMVRFDPTEPSQAALSWLQAVEQRRWGAVVLQSALALGLMVLCVRRWRAIYRPS